MACRLATNSFLISHFSFLIDSVDTRKTHVNFYNPLRFPRFPGDRNPAGATSVCRYLVALRAFGYAFTLKTPYND